MKRQDAIKILMFDKYSLGGEGKVAVRADKILAMEEFTDKIRIDFATDQNGVRSVFVLGNWDLVYTRWLSALG